MKVTTYLCIKKVGSSYAPKGSVRVVKTTPSLDQNEIAMRLNIELPDELFSKPRLEASISIPKDSVSQPIITADIIDNMQEIIKQNTGVEVRLNLVSVEEESE